MTGNDFLLKDARELLAQCDASEAVKTYYRDLPLGHIWQGNEPLKRAYLSESSSFDGALSKLQSQLFDHAGSMRDRELSAEWHLENFGDLCAAPKYGNGEIAIVRGRPYLPDSFRQELTSERLSATVPHGRVKRVIELGAGTGQLARRIFRDSGERTKHVIIDLPDTLVFSMMFLRAEFPDASWQWAGDPGGGWEAHDGHSDFVFVPVGMEHTLHGQSFDLFVNTASMGEMPIATVKHWFDFVQNKIDCKYILSVNRFLSLLSPQTVSWRQNENTTAFQFDRRWKILDWELTPDFLRCPWANRHARQLLVISERMAEEQSTDRDLVGDAMCGSWANPHRELSVQDHPLTCDFTMNGPLFMLWEAHRLGLSGAADGLKGYMQFLRHGRPDMVFEEECHL